MGAVVDGLKIRQQGINTSLRDLAYRRLILTRQIEEIDQVMQSLEAATQTNQAIEVDISNAALETAAKLADMTPEEADAATDCEGCDKENNDV